MVVSREASNGRKRAVFLFLKWVRVQLSFATFETMPSLHVHARTHTRKHEALAQLSALEVVVSRGNVGVGDGFALRPSFVTAVVDNVRAHILVPTHTHGVTHRHTSEPANG